MAVKKDLLINWLLFSVLALVWGSSFILMKEGLKALTPYQVASLRIFSAGLMLLPVALFKIHTVNFRSHLLIFLSGILGSFIPAYLFCIAETRVTSALAGLLNSLTPLFTILIGFFFFRLKFPANRLAGLWVGFAGMLLLFFAQRNAPVNHHFYALLIILATFFYGLNVNVVNKFLNNTNSLTIVSLAFVWLLIPSGLILLRTGYFSLGINTATIKASAASAVLGIFGTALASWLFYILLKRSGALFSSMVTYCIPLVAIGWGLLAGEPVTLLMLAGLIVILAGVYIANR